MTEDTIVKSKIWRPDGQPYYVDTCVTHDKIAGSLVADGHMTEAEYWPMVAAGYLSTIRYHHDQYNRRAAAEYAVGWIDRIMEYNQ